MTDPEISLTVVGSPVKLLEGQPPFDPSMFLMCGYTEDGEFFVVSSLTDVEIGFAIDRVFKLLSDRLK
jgi:hypothetical protein